MYIYYEELLTNWHPHHEMQGQISIMYYGAHYSKFYDANEEIYSGIRHHK